MNENDNNKFIGVIACRDAATKMLFKCILYSKALAPGNTTERILNSDQDLKKLEETLYDHDFIWHTFEKEMNQADFDKMRNELIEQAKYIAEQLEKAAEIRRTRIDETQRNAKVSNLKIWSNRILPIALAIALPAVGFAAYVHVFTHKNAVAPALTSQATTTLPEGKTVDERIAAMEAQFAKSESYYDITNPDEVEKRVNILIGYFEKMQKGVITKGEATDFYLLLNGIKPSEGVDIDELMRKIQLTAAYDPYFDWREVAGQEVVANKRDSVYLDIYLKAINDWKQAAASGNMVLVAETGKELVATAYYGMIVKEPLDTKASGIGAVKMADVSLEMQAFITGYVGMTLNYPGYDIVAAIGKVPYQGNAIDVNSVARLIAGPQIVPAGENGATDKGGEQGLAQSTMNAIATKYRDGGYPECPDQIKTGLNNPVKQSVKTLK